ncbi:S16 family serine protease, partial [Streptomyces minutiscleroticus]
PAGAVPKDGPSAGVTMTTALASLIASATADALPTSPPGFARRQRMRCAHSAPAPRERRIADAIRARDCVPGRCPPLRSRHLDGPLRGPCGLRCAPAGPALAGRAGSEKGGREAGSKKGRGLELLRHRLAAPAVLGRRGAVCPTLPAARLIRFPCSPSRNPSRSGARVGLAMGGVGRRGSGRRIDRTCRVLVTASN